MIPVGEGAVKASIMSSDHQKERTHFFALPRELLVLVFKAQSSITGKSHRTVLPSCTSGCKGMQEGRQVIHLDLQLMQNIDVVHLAETCHYLRNIYKSDHKIARTVLQREIPCYEVRIAQRSPSLVLEHLPQ